MQEDYINVKTLMPRLKTIAIEVSYTQQGYINWVIQLLNLFPCLEALYILEVSLIWLLHCFSC
jgi:hypothetical protein